MVLSLGVKSAEPLECGTKLPHSKASRSSTLNSTPLAFYDNANAANRYAEETRIPDLISGSARAPIGLLAARQPGGDGLPLRGDFAARRSGRRVGGSPGAGRSRRAGRPTDD